MRLLEAPNSNNMIKILVHKIVCLLNQNDIQIFPKEKKEYIKNEITLHNSYLEYINNNHTGSKRECV